MKALLDPRAVKARSLFVRGLQSGLGAIFVAGSLVAAPVTARTASAQPTTAESLAAMQARDQTLLDIGWKLATTNAPFCDNTRPDIGLMLLDTGSFPNPAEIDQALGVIGNILVQATAEGSPANEAGLASPMPIVAIDDQITALPVALRPQPWQHLVELNRRIGASLQSKGSVRLLFQRADGLHKPVTITGIAACNASIEQRDGEDRAQADGTRILIGSNFPGFAYPEEEFAAAIAHELAHIVLGHSAWLDSNGRTRSNVRLTEREADRLAPWLLANAGYDPLAAERFMRRWGPDHSGGLFRKRTHDGWNERAEAIAAEAGLVVAAMENHENGAADWQRHFTREIMP